LKMRCQSGSGWTELAPRACHGRPVSGRGCRVVAIRRHRPHQAGQRGQTSMPLPPTLSHALTHLCMASLFRSHTRRANRNAAPSPSHTLSASTPPCHCAIARAHRSAITSSTSLTTHCLNLSQGKRLRVSSPYPRPCAEHHRACIRHGRAPPSCLAHAFLSLGLG